MSREAKLVQVEIFGQVYRLRAEDDAAYVESLAAYVDGKMREVSRQTKAVDSLKVAVLTALNIADEHHRAVKPEKGAGEPQRGESAAGAGSAEVKRRSAALIQILDDALAG